MKKTVMALILTIISFSTYLVSQTLSLANANPVGLAWEHENPWGYPELRITSPANGGTYHQNSVWLNLTVTKPSNWTEFEGQLEYVAYLIDGNREDLIGGPGSLDEIKIAVEDSLKVVNPPLEFNISLKLTGLSDGMHHIDVKAEGLVEDATVGRVYDYTIYFTITGESSPSPTPSPTQHYGLKLSPPQQIAVLSGTIAVACTVLLAYYFKKRQRGRSP